MGASAAIPLVHELGTHVFGIEGLTPGAVGIILTMIGLAIIWYIRGAADRKRAANDGVTSLAGANNALFQNLNQEVQRLTSRVAAQDMRISAQDSHIMKQDKRISDLEKELADARALVDAVRKKELGAIRNAAQSDLSTVKILKELGKNGKN